MPIVLGRVVSSHSEVSQACSLNLAGSDQKKSREVTSKFEHNSA